SVLLEHPAVSECAVVGLPDELRGQSVHACVVPVEGIDTGELLADELREFVKARIAVYKCPRSIEFRTELPRSATGKVQRHALRGTAGSVPSGLAQSPPVFNSRDQHNFDKDLTRG